MTEKLRQSAYKYTVSVYKFVCAKVGLRVEYFLLSEKFILHSEDL